MAPWSHSWPMEQCGSTLRFDRKECHMAPLRSCSYISDSCRKGRIQLDLNLSPSYLSVCHLFQSLWCPTFRLRSSRATCLKVALASAYCKTLGDSSVSWRGRCWQTWATTQGSLWSPCNIDYAQLIFRSELFALQLSTLIQYWQIQELWRHASRSALQYRWDLSCTSRVASCTDLAALLSANSLI